MDLNERLNGANDDALVIAVRGVLSTVWTALPVVAQSSDGHTSVHQAAIHGTFTDPASGKVTTGPMAPFADVPVHFAGGGGVTSTHPIVKGDEGICLFNCVNQDSHHQNGGTENDPVDSRRHALSDARYIPGGRSNPRKLSPAPSSTSSQQRSDDGKHVNDVHPQNGITAASATKHLINVAGATGTLHGVQNIVKNAAGALLMQTVTAAGLPPPGALTVANAKKVTGQPLPCAGPQAGAIASIMGQVLSGGPAALFSNPIAAATSALTGAAASLAGGLGGATATIAALTGGGGLTAAVGALAGRSSALSGATVPAPGGYGLPDVLAHGENLATYFGSAAAAPPSVSMATVAEPLNSAPLMATYQAQIIAICAQVNAGTMTDAAGAAAISALTVQVNAILTNSNAAIATLQTAQPAMDLALAAASAGVSQNPALVAVAATLSSASPTLAALTTAVSAMITLSGPEAAAAASFPDASADQQGATGS